MEESMLKNFICILILTAFFYLEGNAFVTLAQKSRPTARVNYRNRSMQRKPPCEQMDYTPTDPPVPPSFEEESQTPTNLPRKTIRELQRAVKKCVKPGYPPMAKVARIGGDVKVEIVVDEEGNIVSARAVSGHPLLKDAAVQAANRWKFEPFIINGYPGKVVGTIKLTF